MPLVPRTVFSFNTDINLSETIHSLPSLQSEISHFLLVRYISIAACAVLFYDHLLNARKEVELIWKAPHSVAKFAFLLYQYATPASMTLLVYSISGDAQGLNDKHLVPILAVLSAVFGSISDVLAVLHVSALWKRNVKVFAGLVAAFLVTTCAAVICRIIGLSAITPTVYHDVSLNICATGRKPLLLVVPWSAGLIFDVVVISLMFWSAFNTSRAQSTPLIWELRSGGIGYFVLVSAIRIFNLVLTVVAPLWVYGLVATVSWPAFAIALARFIFGLRRQRQYFSMIVADENQAEEE